MDLPLIYRSPRNPHAHLTAIVRPKVSFPTRKLWEAGLIRGRVLDFGCGRGSDLAFLSANGVAAEGFDPHYAPYWPTGQFDTILCHYVLNVLLPEEQTYVLLSVSELLKPGGTAYFTVRRDLRREGFRLHAIHRVETYQCNVRLPYPSWYTAKHCEIYAYQHCSVAAGYDRAADPFLTEPVPDILTESATCYAMPAPQPVRPGHALIVPKRQVARFFELPLKEQTACLLVANRVMHLEEQRHGRRDFNLVINQGKPAGQQVGKAHVHLIPRED